MQKRKHRSGKQQSCLICRQSEEMRETVKKMGPDHTRNEIATWLKKEGINASDSQIGYFLHKSGVPSRRKKLSADGDYKTRMVTYVEQLLNYKLGSYAIRNLCLKGPRWTAVTTRLRHAGMIKPAHEYKPIRWEILASKDEIRAWRDSELKRLKKEEEHKTHR